MKISTNLQPQVQGRKAGVKSAPRQVQGKDFAQRLGNINNVQARQMLQNAPMERGLSNAMVVMQKARTIVQQAMTVSSQLRANAADAITTGKLDFQQIGQQMAGINNEFSEFSVSITPPSVPQMSNLDREAIQRNVSELNTMAQDRNFDRERIAVIDNDLRQIEGNLNRGIKSVTNELQQTAGNYNAQRPDVQKLGRDIVQNYPQALAAQGNIVNENAGPLLG